MASTTPTSAPRKPLVGVSFKMYFDIDRTRTYISDTLRLLQPTLPTLSQPADIFVIPDFITLASVHAQIAAATPSASSASPPLQLGAQDVHSADFGAFTGEVSPVVLAQAGVRYVELGHAERRRLFGETDADVAAKARAVAANRMVPLVCIGEVTRPADTDAVDTATLETTVVDEVWTQVAPVLQAVGDDADVVLAYEPVWAIGAAEPAPPRYVTLVTKAIRARFEREYGATQVQRRRLRILYGGSAGPGLFDKLREGVDGLFLGRFAHKPEAFVETIKEVAGVKAAE